MRIDSNKKKLGEIEFLLKKMQTELKDSTCFFSHCNHQATASHTLSESQVLSSLRVNPKNTNEELYLLEDKIVVDFKEINLSTVQKTYRTLQKKRVASASTFYGFCGLCDRLIFKMLDNNNYVDSVDVNFLHTLRAYAYKVIKDREQAQLLLKMFNKSSNTNFEEAEINDINEILNPQNLEIKHLLGASNRLFKIIPELLNLHFQKLPDTQMITQEEWKKAVEVLSLSHYDLSIFEINPDNQEFKSIQKLQLLEENFPMKAKKLKETVLKIIGIAEEVSSEALQMEEIEILQSYSEELDLHIKETIQGLTDVYMNRGFDQFDYFHRSIHGFYPIAGSFIFVSKNNLEFALTFFPEKNSNLTHFVFSAWKGNQEHRKYLQVVEKEAEDQFKLFVSSIILDQATNTYFAKDYINSFDKKQQEILTKPNSFKFFMSFNLFSKKQIRVNPIKA